MSFEINWEQLQDDHNLQNSIRDHLSSYLSSMQLPSYVKNLEVAELSIGSDAPKVSLKQVSDPLSEFYQEVYGDDYLDEACKSPNDIQFLAEVEYSGNLYIALKGELVLNYPSPGFMALPVKLKISNIGFHSLCLITYIAKEVFFTFLCDVEDTTFDDHAAMIDPNSIDSTVKRPLERISIIRSLSINTEIGETHQKDGSVLKSVGKLEQFLSDKLKDFLRQEIAWPSWLNFDLNEESDSDSDSD